MQPSLLRQISTYFLCQTYKLEFMVGCFFPNALFLWLTIMISIYKKWACRHQRYKQSFQSRLSDSLQFYQGSRYIELETVNRSKEVWSSSIDRDLGIAQFPMTSQNLWSFFLTSILHTQWIGLTALFHALVFIAAYLDTWIINTSIYF